MAAHVDSKVSGDRAGPAQGLRQCATVNEFQVSGRLRRALAPQEPFFSRRKETWHGGAGSRGVTLDFAREPGFDREDIGRGPNTPTCRQLSRGVCEPSGVRPLTRGNDNGAALLYNLVKLGRKPNQNRMLEDLVNVLLETLAGFDHVATDARRRRAGVRGEQLVYPSEHIAQGR